MRILLSISSILKRQFERQPDPHGPRGEQAGVQGGDHDVERYIFLRLDEYALFACGFFCLHY